MRRAQTTASQNIYSIMVLCADDTFSISHYDEEGTWSADEPESTLLGLLYDDNIQCVVQDEHGNNVSITDTGLFTIPEIQKAKGTLLYIGENAVADGTTGRKTGLRGQKPILEGTEYEMQNPRVELFAGIHNINYFSENGTCYYWAGAAGDGWNGKLPTSEHIRKIAGQNVEEISRRLLPTFNNIIIWNGQASVLPFPVKYLKESAKDVIYNRRLRQCRRTDK